MSNNCPLCEIDTNIYPAERQSYYIVCPRCGKYEISIIMTAILNSNPKYHNIKHILSGISRYRTENNLEQFLIMSENIEEIAEEYYVPKNINQKLNMILKYFAKKSNYVGRVISINVDLDYPIAFCLNAKEFSFFLKQLEESVLLKKVSVNNNYILTIEGWKRIEELNKQVIDKRQTFVAMYFNDGLKEVYKNGFSKAIKDCGYEPMRIDMKQHNNKIDDEIVAEIRNSKFLIADFTGNRGGVYFEAGFAMGLDIPVIWTCKKDEIKDVHFDTRQFNHITWEKTDDLYTQLVNRIKATIK